MSEEMSEAAKQEAHRKIMDDINKAYEGKEIAIEPVNKQLKKFVDEIALRGFKFDPREICKMVDAEAKRQYQELFDSNFKGHHLDTLTAAKDETIKWYMEEEERFANFKEMYLKAPEEVLTTLDAPKLEVPESQLPERVVKINKKKK